MEAFSDHIKQLKAAEIKRAQEEEAEVRKGLAALLTEMMDSLQLHARSTWDDVFGDQESKAAKDPVRCAIALVWFLCFVLYTGFSRPQLEEAENAFASLPPPPSLFFLVFVCLSQRLGTARAFGSKLFDGRERGSVERAIRNRRRDRDRRRRHSSDSSTDSEEEERIKEKEKELWKRHEKNAVAAGDKLVAALEQPGVLRWC